MAGAACAACGNASPDPFYALGECRRVDLVEKGTETPIIGAEDMALDIAGGRLIVSAYDRRATEKAARKTEPPEGGLYAVDLGDLFDANTSLSVTPLLDRERFAEGLRPHGVDYADGELAFVNRGYVRDGKQWRMQPSLVRINADSEIVERMTHCAANDVAVVGAETIFTRDHAACGGLARFYENAFARKKSGAYFDGGGALIDGVAFANGVIASNAGFAVAATREKAVHILGKDDAGRAHHIIADVPGAPDNVTFASDGDIIAALHPNLIRLALNRKLGIGKAGSRIVRINAQSHEIELLFDDPSGGAFSAATVGVETDRGLVAGSVTDAGVLVCEKTP